VDEAAETGRLRLGDARPPEGGARLDENNLQSLCKKHHNRKTRRELNARR
jgi:hypothetical protein